MPNINLQIRAVRKEQDAGKIAEIYNNYVLSSIITFEEDPVTEAEMGSRIATIHSAGLPWLVAEVEEDGASRLLGYAYATRWKPRSAYRFAVETTVYVARGSTNKGIGSNLYAALFTQLQKGGLHTALAGISLPNEGSIRLHERFGFRKVAEFEQVGFKLDRWINVAYWQRFL